MNPRLTALRIPGNSAGLPASLPASLVALVFLAFSGGLRGKADISRLWEAVERSDARAVRLAAATVDCNVTRSLGGHSPLTLAASDGSFECTRELLWAGARAEMRNGENKIAKDYLRPGSPGFTGLCLLLRCHAFIQKEARDRPRAAVSHRVIIIAAPARPEHRSGC